MVEREQLSLLRHPAHLLEMSQRLIADGQSDKADVLAQAAFCESGGKGLLGAIANEIQSYKIDRFHRSMLFDELRNSAYAAAIAAMAPGRTVLDIGTGSGFLAMLAARAGARHVYACELDQRIAATAREIIAANGLADHITVLAKHSVKLERETDLSGGVDLVISEIFSDNLLSEGVLPSLRDARQRLCLPHACFLPSRAAIRIALVGFEGESLPRRFSPVGNVAGCDLSLFNRHIANRHSVTLGSGGLELRSAPTDIFEFDFNGAIAGNEEVKIDIRSHGGQVHGIAQWIWFEAGVSHEYENMSQGHWQVLFHAFDAPVDTGTGATIAVGAWRNDKTLLIWQA